MSGAKASDRVVRRAAPAWRALVATITCGALFTACNDDAAPVTGGGGGGTGAVAPAGGAGRHSAGAGASGAGGGMLPAVGGTGGSAGSSPSAGQAGTALGGAAGSGGVAAASGGAAGVSAASAAGAAGGGAAGGGAAGAGGGPPALQSAGCGIEATQALASWVEKPKLMVNGKARQWWVWLPQGYDARRAYRLVFTFHGCGGPSNFIPMQQETGADAIVVRGTGADPGNGGCWTYGGEGDDVKFFDAMLEALSAQYCVDTSRVFAMGYSSGAWMTNTLECTRGDKLRATGTLSGGRVGNLGTCKGKFARATVHDLNDPTNPFDGQGASQELARVIAQNGCDADAAPVPEAPAPCARYQGCDAGYPVIACRTEGKGHDRQDALAMDAFWKLFSSL